MPYTFFLDKQCTSILHHVSLRGKSTIFHNFSSLSRCEARCSIAITTPLLLFISVTTVRITRNCSHLCCHASSMESIGDTSKTEPSDAESCIWIDLPRIPPLDELKSSNADNGDQYWLFSFTTSSIPLVTISARLNPDRHTTERLLLNSSRSKSIALSGIFELLDSPIEKYNLTRLIVPHRSRGKLLSKHQLIKCLYRYTKTDNLKSGVLRAMIDSIKIGKPTESPTPEFLAGVITVLRNYWEECCLLKNSDYSRFKDVLEKYKNEITLADISEALDNLQHTHSDSPTIDSLYPASEHLFDMLYTIAKSSNSELTLNEERPRRTIEMVVSCILNKATINERVVFNAICIKPRGLASAIWYSRSNMWDVIYGIEYLKNRDIQLWKRLLESTRDEDFKRGGKRLDRFKRKEHATFVVKLSVGIPFSIMRCIRMYDEYDRIVDKISVFKDGVKQETEGYCIEEKLDGERSCLHIWRDPKDHEKILTRFYSRGHKAQLWYGSYVGDPDGIISKYLKAAWFDDIEDMILDGEMITFDETKGRLLGFQDVKTCSEMSRNALREGKDLNDFKVYNKLLVYDILYLNGQSLQLTYLKERKKKLLQVFQKFDNDSFKFIHVHKWHVGYNANDLQVAMDNIIKRNGEGLVIKHWESYYFVGRHSPRWIKLKPYYLMDFIDELDITIIGKEGANYLCALYGDSSDDKYRDWFVSFCLVRFGLSNDVSTYIDDKTEGHWMAYKRYESEIDMQEHRVKFGKLKPHYWIYPENSVVITVKAKSIMKVEDELENRFVLATTLRFPYCIGVRYDKDYMECDTISGYEEKVERQGRKNPFDENEKNFVKHRRRKMDTKMDIALRKVNKSFIQTIIKKDDLFSGITFCVKTDCMMDGEWLPLNEVNGILESHGGKITSDPSHCSGNRMLVIADKNTLSVNELRKKFNIFKFKWCEDCIRSKRLVFLDPSHCLVVDEELKELSEKNIDKFGCNFSVQYNDKGIWELSKKYENKSDGSVLSKSQCEKLQFQYHMKKFLVLGYDESTSFQRQILEIQIEIHGGEVTDDPESADYIAVPDGNIKGLKFKVKESIPILSTREILEQCEYIG